MLSERIRPNIEVAPWVVDEVKTLEKRAAMFAEALRKYGKHAPDCLWLTPLPTGAGDWGCDCGFGAVQLEAETPLIA